jgi:hypothetical protein
MVTAGRVPLPCNRGGDMATYTKQMQQIVEDYREAGEEWPASAKTIAGWALETGRWALHRSAAIQKCAEDLARAMREEYFTDAKGPSCAGKAPCTP